MNEFNIGSLYFEQRRDLSALKRQATSPSTARRGRLSPSTRQPVDRSSPLYKACQDFESIFIKQMLNVMRKTVHKTGLMDGGMAEEIFEDMLYDEYALKMAQSRQFGISDMLYKELSRAPSR
jgi:Rod binding domain-containing protein